MDVRTLWIQPPGSTTPRLLAAIDEHTLNEDPRMFDDLLGTTVPNLPVDVRHAVVTLQVDEFMIRRALSPEAFVVPARPVVIEKPVASDG